MLRVLPTGFEKSLIFHAPMLSDLFEFRGRQRTTSERQSNQHCHLTDRQMLDDHRYQTEENCNNGKFYRRCCTVLGDFAHGCSSISCFAARQSLFQSSFFFPPTSRETSARRLPAVSSFFFAPTARCRLYADVQKHNNINDNCFSKRMA